MKVVAFERSVQGTGASRRLRNSGKTPGIIYGGKQESPCAIELDHNALFHALRFIISAIQRTHSRPGVWRNLSVCLPIMGKSTLIAAI
jgi:ribosomal protein L25 (general stress protein Ctc)